MYILTEGCTQGQFQKTQVHNPYTPSALCLMYPYKHTIYTHYSILISRSKILTNTWQYDLT